MRELFAIFNQGASINKLKAWANHYQDDNNSAIEAFFQLLSEVQQAAANVIQKTVDDHSKALQNTANERDEAI